MQKGNLPASAGSRSVEREWAVPDALKLSEKFRRFVVLLSIHKCWTHLRTRSSFAGPLQPVCVAC